MEATAESTQSSRFNGLRDILNHQRSMVLARVREFRRDQEAEKESEPSDDLDVARAFADVETHASLIERSEDLLKLIDGAFTRLEVGRYGICDGCGAERTLDLMLDSDQRAKFAAGFIVYNPKNEGAKP